MRIRVVTLALLFAVICLAASALAQTTNEPASKVLLKKTEPRMVAAMKHRGPFTEVPVVLANLMGEMAKGGYLAAGPPMCLYFNSPEDTAPKDLLWQVMIPVVYPGPIGDADLDKMTFKFDDVSLVAYTYHIGPYEKINDSYTVLFDWAKRNQYKFNGSPVELYWSDPATTPGEKLVTEIWLPVEEKKVPGVVR
jgi:AraC family transcriptional regulator